MTPRKALAEAVPGVPSSSEGHSLDVWLSVSEADRKALQDALQHVADKEGEAVKWSGVDTLDPAPSVEVFHARLEGDILWVHFRYELGIFRFAQSGSDWTEIHTHTGVASWRDGVLLSCELERSARSYIDRGEG